MNKCNVHFSSVFRLILNLSNLIRFNLDQAVSAILFMCSIQEHVLDMVSPKCLWLVIVIHFQRGATGCCLRNIRRVEVFVGLQSTSQSCDHPLIVSRSVFNMKAAVCGLSIIIKIVVSSANRRIDERILFIKSLI